VKRAETIPRTGPPATTEELLVELGQLPPRHPGRARLRARAIEQNLPLAHHLARRYAGRGEQLDDLTQVAALALVKAVDGYDPARPHPFASYAIPTITGALKRHFRDTVWAIRVARSSQELLHRVRTASDDLTQQHGRHPSTADLAEHLHVTGRQLHIAAEAGQVYQLQSLSTPGGSDSGPDSADRVDLIGSVDPRYADVDERLSPPPIRRLVAALPRRERQVLAMRFSGEMTQSTIATKVGVSQMQVSRLLRRSLTQLRDGLVVPASRP
jgi:RNA polymerase sigma-B factor